MMSGTLVIETGARCNNRCLLCNQWAVRSRGELLGEPSTGELLDRMHAGREAGYSDVAFTGGEPTVRRDLLDLVKNARALGFGRIGITTNARMLARRDMARDLVEAGLTGASVTLQGPDSWIHESITGVAGSFKQTVRGMDNLRKAAQDSRFDLSSVTVIVPENADHLDAILGLAGSLGAMLHIVQPFIVARENIHEAGRFLLGIDELVSAVESAAAGVAARKGRIKPYNIPPCVLSHLGEVIEIQDYPISTFHEFQSRVNEHPGFVLDGQTWRPSRCDDCPAGCPGFRVEHLPEAAAIDAIVDDAAAFVAKRPGQGLILTSTDLLTSAGLYRLLDEVSRMNTGPLTVTWGGYARTGADDFLDACRRFRVDEVAMISIPSGLRPPHGHMRLPGNIEKLVADLNRMGGSGLTPSLFMVANMLFSDDYILDSALISALVKGMSGAGGRRVYLAACEVLNDGVPPPDEEFGRRVRKGVKELVDMWRRDGIEPYLLKVPDPPGAPVKPTLQDQLSGIAEPMDWDRSLLRHRFTGLGFGWVMWSNPIWLFPPPSSAQTTGGRITS